MPRASAKFLTVVAYVTLAMFGRTDRLHAMAQTSAVCSSTGPEDWSWMNNQNGSSPCLAAAAISQPCFNSVFNVPPLVSNGYQPPTVSGPVATVNKCYCSWAAYNLYEACTICQNRQDLVITWSLWSQSCGDSLTTGRAYPPGYTIPDNLTFPNWAAADPTTWEDQRFNSQQAQQIEDSKPGDLQDPSALLATPTPTPSARHESNNLGAIVGGVVGGVLVLAIGIAAAIFLHCRHRRQRARQAQQAPQISQVPLDHHARNPSDISAKSYGVGFGYSRLGHTSSPSNGSDSRLLSSPATFRTHNTSHASLTHDSLMASTSYPGTPPPQPGNQSQRPAVMTPHGLVSPFTLERPSSSQDTSSGHERKRSEASTGSLSAAPAANRGPMNPPAYSEAPRVPGDFASIAPDQASIYSGSASIVTTPPNNSPRLGHDRGPSAGSTSSNTSSTSGGYWTHGVTASLSGAADIISQMGPGNAPGPSGGTPAYTGPSSSANAPRDRKRG